MRRLSIFYLTISIVLISCSATPTEVLPTADVDALYTQAAKTIVAGLVQTELPVDATQAPAIELPTQTPVIASQEYSDIFSWNYLAEQTSGDVTIQIARVIIADKESVEEELNLDFDKAEIFLDKAVVAEILFKITNNSDQIVTLHPNQGTVIVGSEQIDLADYLMSGTSFGDNTGGDFYPGVTAIGGMWFGVKRTPLEEINSMMFASRGPVTSDAWDSLGPDYQIQLDLSEHTFQPMPDELK